MTIEDIKIVNNASGNHGALGMHLYGVEHVIIDGVDIDIFGTDINGDNNAITLFGSDDVLITNSLLRSRQADGVAVWHSINVDFRVDDQDVQAVKDNFGAVTGWAGGNFDLDTGADAIDLAMLRSNIGFMVPAPSAALPSSAGTQSLTLIGAIEAIPLTVDQDIPQASREEMRELGIEVMPQASTVHPVHDKLPPLLMSDDTQNNGSRLGAYRDVVDSVIADGQIVLPTRSFPLAVAIQTQIDHTGVLGH